MIEEESLMAARKSLPLKHSSATFSMKVVLIQVAAIILSKTFQNQSLKMLKLSMSQLKISIAKERQATIEVEVPQKNTFPSITITNRLHNSLTKMILIFPSRQELTKKSRTTKKIS